jgi:NDP-sugar pyrophosphorylase family protein
MEAIILSAGLGTRLMPLTKNTPKPLVKVLGCPILEYNLNYLNKLGFKKIFINRYKFFEKFEKIKFPKNLELNFSIEKDILGTLGGVLSFEKEIKEEDFFIINGDVFFDFDLKKAYEKHKNKKALLTMILKEKDHEKVSSVFIDKENKVTSIVNKDNKLSKERDFLFTGISIVNKKIFSYLKNKKGTFSCLVKDFIIPFLKKDKIYSYILKKNDFWIETGNMDQYKKANMELLEILEKNNFYSSNIKEVLKKNNFIETKNNIFFKKGSFKNILPPSVIEKDISKNTFLEKIGPFVYIGNKATFSKKFLVNEIIL